MTVEIVNINRTDLPISIWDSKRNNMSPMKDHPTMIIDGDNLQYFISNANETRKGVVSILNYRTSCAVDGSLLGIQISDGKDPGQVGKICARVDNDLLPGDNSARSEIVFESGRFPNEVSVTVYNIGNGRDDGTPDGNIFEGVVSLKRI